MKKTIQKLHLWLGLASGLIVFLIAITGCIYVFSEDIKPLIYKDRRLVPVPENLERLPIEALLETAEKAIDRQYPCNRILVPNFPDHSIGFMFEKTNEDAFLYPYYMEFNKTVYIDPYTGKVVKVEDTKWEFFNVVFWIHITLFLGYNDISSAIVVGSVWIFIFLLVSGLVLWWPRNRSQKKRSFSFKWSKSARWRQKNYDFHKILGFYVVLLALISALTGLFWASESFNTAVKWIANAGETAAEVAWPDPVGDPVANPLEYAFAETLQRAPHSKYILVRLPSKPTAPYIVRSYGDASLNYTRVVYYYDPVTAELLYTETFSNKSNGDRIQALNYDIHAGTIGGMPTKILSFVMSLIVASLPITGFFIWWGKRKR